MSEKISLVIADCDGVLTDGSMLVDSDGREVKKFSTYDGVAIDLLRQRNIVFAIISGENSPALAARAKKLSVDNLYMGVSDKLSVMNVLLEDLGLSSASVAYCGDDLNDIECLKKVGKPFCPSTAQPEVKEINGMIQLPERGGDGVLRGLVRFLVDGNSL